MSLQKYFKDFNKLADLREKAQAATEAQMSTLSDANKSMEEAAKADNRTEEAEAEKNSSQKEEKPQGNTDASTKSIDLRL